MNGVRGVGAAWRGKAAKDGAVGTHAVGVCCERVGVSSAPVRADASASEVYCAIRISPGSRRLAGEPSAEGRNGYGLAITAR